MVVIDILPERLSSEEVAALDNVKVLISQLYSQLNLDQHQLSKERELLSRLELLKEERQPLEEVTVVFVLIQMACYCYIQYATIRRDQFDVRRFGVTDSSLGRLDVGTSRR